LRWQWQAVPAVVVIKGVGFAFRYPWREANLAFAEQYPRLGFGRVLVPFLDRGI